MGLITKMPEIWDLYDREGNKTGKIWERKFGNYKEIPEQI